MAKKTDSDAEVAKVETGSTDETKIDQPELVPVNAAVADPAPATEMDPASGAFVEPAVLNVGADHPAVETHPRAGTTAVQNGIDWNDPTLEPGDDNFLGQGLDLSVYGSDAKK